jgi:hypothetical protein
MLRTYMSKKIEKSLSENFNKAFNFEHFTDQEQTNTQPVGRDFVNQFVSEMVRLSSLSIPLTTHHIENIKEIPTSVEYPTHFQNIKYQLKCIQFLYGHIEQLQSRLINYPDGNEILPDDVKALDQLHETFAQSVFTLGMLVGSHNQEMHSSYFTETGITKLQSEQLKSANQYNQKYRKALELTKTILQDFYNIEDNHPYKPSLVIDYIEMLCGENRVEYPKDRKSEFFTEFLIKCLKAITPHQNWKGATKIEYKQIDKNSFKKKYMPYIYQLAKK